MDEAITFGKYQNLVGTISHPEGDAKPVAAIFLTAGMLHHAGPFRLHVEVARKIARIGVRSIRFDLSGIGESLGVGDSEGTSIDRAAHETKQAMDYLQSTYGVEKFILFGLCSGADDSVHAALSDDRIIGIVTMDGCGYRTPKYHWQRLAKHYLPRAMMLEKWVGLVTRWLGTNTGTPETLRMGTDIREFPEQAVAEKEFQQLANRGVRMHFIYTGGVGDYYNYAGQFFDMFPNVQWNDTASTKYFAHMDHIGMLREDREQLVDEIYATISEIALDQAAKADENEMVILQLPGVASSATTASH